VYTLLLVVGLSLIILQNDLGVHRNHHVPVHYDALCHEEGAVFTPDWIEVITELFLQREETERFRKIDAKRGGRGFV